MLYSSYQYLWPPRPEKATDKTTIPFFEKKGWVGQLKKNGTCSVIAVAPDRTITAMNRHNEAHKLWTPTAKSSAAFKALPGRGWYVFVAELLHSKVEGIRDTNYIFDILVDDGEYLVGTTFAERQDRLAAIFDLANRESGLGHYVIDGNTQVAKLLPKGFLKLFDGLTKPEDEGIVLKNPKAKLELCARQSANQNWQVKTRRPHKNFTF